MRKATEQIDGEISKMHAEILTLYAKRKEIINNQMFECGHCKKKSVVNSVPRMITYKWDYCEDYNVSDEIRLICPKCNWLNRCLTDKAIDRYKDIDIQFIKGYEETQYYSNKSWTKDDKDIKCPYIDFVNI